MSLPKNEIEDHIFYHNITCHAKLWVCTFEGRWEQRAVLAPAAGPLHSAETCHLRTAHCRCCCSAIPAFGTMSHYRYPDTQCFAFAVVPTRVSSAGIGLHMATASDITGNSPATAGWFRKKGPPWGRETPEPHHHHNLIKHRRNKNIAYGQQYRLLFGS
jgi:hypothetical protein